MSPLEVHFPKKSFWFCGETDAVENCSGARVVEAGEKTTIFNLENGLVMGLRGEKTGGWIQVLKRQPRRLEKGERWRSQRYGLEIWGK